MWQIIYSIRKHEIHIHIVHRGHKDYNCNSCGKLFSRAGNLKKHMKTIHEGERNHKCDSCERKFSELGRLKKHIQKFMKV